MGHQSLNDMIETGLDQRSVLIWHLQSNHYPPIPYEMVEVAEQAIEACREWDHDRTIPLPEGVIHRFHGSKPPAWAIVQDLHLDLFLV